jgi:hypothetical protein
MTDQNATEAFDALMPEPECYRNYWDEGITYSSEKEGITNEALYSADQMRTAMQAVWDAATEWAAKVVEGTEIIEASNTQYAQLGDAVATREACAAAIRASGGKGASDA